MFTDEAIEVRKVDKNVLNNGKGIEMMIAGPPGPPHWHDLPKWLDNDTCPVLNVFPFRQDPSQLCEDISEGESKVVPTFLGRKM